MCTVIQTTYNYVRDGCLTMDEGTIELLLILSYLIFFSIFQDLSSKVVKAV